MSSGFSEALMTTIDRNLKWRNHADDFDADEKKILLALSNKTWEWWTLDNIEALTQLEPGVLDRKLAGLIRRKVIKGSIYEPNTPEARPIFGLMERVGGPLERRMVAPSPRRRTSGGHLHPTARRGR